jgi:hypothetical protein
MPIPQMQPARLEEARLSRLRRLEQEMGTCLVALEPRAELADLSQEQMQQLQAGEQELGVVLLAYACPSAPPGASAPSGS